MKRIMNLLALAVLLAGCSVETLETANPEEQLALKAKNPHDSFEIPALTAGESTENSLQIIITAGATGATGGLSVRWMTLEDYSANGGWDNDLAGHANLNSNKNNDYGLEAGDSFEFFLEDYIEGEGDSWDRALECGQSYMFIVQARQDGKKQKSDYSAPQEFSTAACDTVCAHGFGYWKTHGPDAPGNQDNEWPVSELTLGETLYNSSELLEILRTPVKGDPIISLQHHLITAKFNVANGVEAATVAETIEDADAVLAGDVELEKEEINAVKDALEAFNEGPLNCGDDDDDEEEE